MGNGKNLTSILLVEDDPVIGQCTSETLECFEFKVTHVTDAEKCFEAVSKKVPSLILLEKAIQ